ncbi:MAG: hypothetical protein AJITA_00135 [Acetilactobacillus jinshanensis]
MNNNNVKMNPDALKLLTNLDDIQHGINASGIFALLVLHMNGNNVAKVPMAMLIQSSIQKARLTGVRLNTNVSLENMVDKTSDILEKHHMIISENLPLGKGLVCYKISSNLVQL